MKSTFEKKIEIKFWYEYSKELENLNAEQRDELENGAKESVFEFISKFGYTSGELITVVGDKEFYGWWQYRIINE
ncbi:MAG: hypothetical protein LBH60_04845 [Prevotellaceae bacterium]|jgi:hypothetical protein|nr:hypothetical protein [Prevotellaceae bacterium]